MSERNTPKRSGCAVMLVALVIIFIAGGVVMGIFSEISGRDLFAGDRTTVTLTMEYLGDDGDEEIMEAVYGNFLINVSDDDGSCRTVVPDENGEVRLKLEDGTYSWFCSVLSEPDPVVMENLVYIDPDGEAHPFLDNWDLADSRLFTVDEGDVYGTTRLRFDYEGEPWDFYGWALANYDASVHYNDNDYEDEGFDLEELTPFLPVVLFLLIFIGNVRRVKKNSGKKTSGTAPARTSPAPARTYTEPTPEPARTQSTSRYDRPKSWQVGQSGQSGRSGRTAQPRPAKRSAPRPMAPKELPTAANTFESDSNVGGFEEGRSNRSFYDESNAPEYAFDVGRHKKPPMGFDR